jgi:hypothetical protein
MRVVRGGFRFAGAASDQLGEVTEKRRRSILPALLSIDLSGRIAGFVLFSGTVD